MQRREDIKRDDERDEEEDSRPTYRIHEQRKPVTMEQPPYAIDDWVWCEACRISHPKGGC